MDAAFGGGFDGDGWRVGWGINGGFDGR